MYIANIQTFVVMYQHMKKPLIDTEEALILTGIARNNSLREIADEVQRDVSVISRRLQNIDSRLNILQKKNNRWVLKESGHRLIKAFNQYVADLDRAYSMTDGINLGCSRAFASDVLIPYFKYLPEMNNTTIISTEDGVEQLLMENKIDIGFDCGDPVNENIRFKRVCDEEMVVVCSKKYYDTHFKTEKDFTYIHYNRLNFDYVKKTLGKDIQIGLSLNDLIAVKSALMNHLGCAVVPKYLVYQEMNSKFLIKTTQAKTEKLVYSVFYRADSGLPKETVDQYVKWLKLVSKIL